MNNRKPRPLPMFTDEHDVRRLRSFLISDFEHDGDFAHAEMTLQEMGFKVEAFSSFVDDDGDLCGKVMVKCTAEEAALIRDSI